MGNDLMRGTCRKEFVSLRVSFGFTKRRTRKEQVADFIVPWLLAGKRIKYLVAGIEIASAFKNTNGMN